VRTSRRAAPISCLLALACLLLLSACGNPAGSNASIGPAGPVNIELGIYSGRPDPGWTLSTTQAAALESILATLPDRTATPPVGGLGYHGFTILFPGSPMVAYLGTIAPPGDGPRAGKLDASRSVERYLLETGRPYLNAVEYGEVAASLGNG
jgi:hypothetical protein